MTASTRAQLTEHPDRELSANGGPSLVVWQRYALNVRLGAGAGNDVPLGHAQRPIWRGGVHRIGLIIAAPAVIALALHSNGDARTRLSVVVYAVGLCSMLAVSTTYHRWVHGLRARSAWRRADQAAIFAAIAGSSTPIVLAALPGTTGLVLVGAVLACALVGAGFKLGRWGGGDRAGIAMYVATVAVGSIAIPWVWARHGVAPAALVIGGGIVYVVGAALFAKNWPTLRATVFSYHEVWHVFTLVAAAAQFTAIWLLTT